jgi:beta-lactam-binding protein with PASTA domain
MVYALRTPLCTQNARFIHAINMEQAMKNFLVLAVTAFALAVFALPAQAQQVAVPNVVGVPYADAVKTLQAAGFKTSMTMEKTAASAQNGKVSKQKPEAGQKADKNSAVILTVYSYVETVKVAVAPPVASVPVPMVNKMPLEKARETAKKAGYELTVTLKETTDIALQGCVVEQQTTVPAGSKSFAVVVGLLNSVPRAVPNFVGKHVDALGDPNGVKTTFGAPVTVTNKDDSNKVLAQSIAPGTKVKEGTIVTLTLGAWAPPPPENHVPDVLNLSRDEAFKKMEAAGCSSAITTKDTAWPEQDGKIISMDVAPKSVCKKNVPIGMKVGKFTPSALDVRAVPIPDNKTYLLMIKGGTPPYDVRASYEIPKTVYAAGTKYCEIVPLKDSPPGWVSYRIIPRADMTARFSITDAKGVKHQYDVAMKKDAK